MSRYLNISTDNTLGGDNPSDENVASQKAVKGYADGKRPSYNNIPVTSATNIPKALADYTQQELQTIWNNN